MLNRLLRPLKSDSFFLFGARGTGKTTFLNSFFKEQNQIYIDLLSADDEDKFSSNPDALEAIAQGNPNTQWIIIDEIQKAPKLLDIVHKVIETKDNKIKFALTGSSARKLKKGAANLLAGRALVNNLYPLTFLEMGKLFDLNQFLRWGGLPKITNTPLNEAKEEFLKSYARTYLKEEIWAEHIIKELDPFRKFLEVAAQMNSEIINYSKIAKQIGSTPNSVKSYFEILEETLVATILDPYHTSIRKRIVESSKFYFFDLGVKRALGHTVSLEVMPGTYDYGKSFEHFIITQIMALHSYYKKDYSFGYLKTKDGAEIDLIIERPGMPLALIEIKSSTRVDTCELNNLNKFAKDFKNAKAFCLCREKYPQKFDSVEILPWQEGIMTVLDIRPPLDF
ncbi:MAG: AAA family ATPase [Pseudomonadota bacterium]